MNDKDALDYAIRLYWDYGVPVTEIKPRLFEECGLTPSAIERVTSHLGKAIGRFDSDARADYIIDRLEESF